MNLDRTKIPFGEEYSAVGAEDNLARYEILRNEG